MSDIQSKITGYAMKQENTIHNTRKNPNNWNQLTETDVRIGDKNIKALVTIAHVFGSWVEMWKM